MKKFLLGFLLSIISVPVSAQIIRTDVLIDYTQPRAFNGFYVGLAADYTYIDYNRDFIYNYTMLPGPVTGAGSTNTTLKDNKLDTTLVLGHGITLHDIYIGGELELMSTESKKSSGEYVDPVLQQFNYQIQYKRSWGISGRLGLVFEDKFLVYALLGYQIGTFKSAYQVPNMASTYYLSNRYWRNKDWWRWRICLDDNMRLRGELSYTLPMKSNKTGTYSPPTAQTVYTENFDITEINTRLAVLYKF